MSEPAPLPDDAIDPDLLNDPAAQAWFEKHLTDLREEAYGPRILYTILAAAFVVGFVSYVAGYLLKSTAPAEPFGFLADLTYTFGFALWTAAVVVVLVEIIPEAKRRQIRRALEAYEAVRRDKAERRSWSPRSVQRHRSCWRSRRGRCRPDREGQRRTTSKSGGSSPNENELP